VQAIRARARFGFPCPDWVRWAKAVGLGHGRSGVSAVAGRERSARYAPHGTEWGTEAGFAPVVRRPATPAGRGPEPPTRAGTEQRRAWCESGVHVPVGLGRRRGDHLPGRVVAGPA